MSRQLEQVIEERSRKREKKIVEAVEYGLERAVRHSGGELTGLALKINPGSVLLILKAHLAGRPQVAFVGGEDFGGVFLKAVRDGETDLLRWRDDKYGGQS